MVNVPEAVWIDEAGTIVRPAENAGSFDAFRVRDRVTGIVPANAANATRRAREIYLNAIRDWVGNGARSPHVLDPASARSQMRAASDDSERAHALFRLGNHLLRLDRKAEAQRYFAEAISRHPDSWNIWRQVAEKTETGFAASPAFWARVDALGPRRYRERASIEGLP